jgi:hypothetical protein
LKKRPLSIKTKFSIKFALKAPNFNWRMFFYLEK